MDEIDNLTKKKSVVSLPPLPQLPIKWNDPKVVSDWLGTVDPVTIIQWLKKLQAVVWEKLSDNMMTGQERFFYPRGFRPVLNAIDDDVCEDIRGIILHPVAFGIRVELQNGIGGFTPGLTLFEVTGNKIVHLLSLERAHNKKVIKSDWVKTTLVQHKKLVSDKLTIDVAVHDLYCVKSMIHAVELTNALELNKK